MDVEAAVARRVEDRLRQDQAVSDDDADVGVKGRELRLRLVGAQAAGVAHLDPERLGAGMDGAWPVFLSAACRTRRLGIDADDLVPRRDQRVERGDREVGRAHEDDLHVAPFRTLRRSMSRFTRLSRSTKRRPSRWSIWCWTLVDQRPSKSRVTSAPVSSR